MKKSEMKPVKSAKKVTAVSEPRVFSRIKSAPATTRTKVKPKVKKKKDGDAKKLNGHATVGEAPVLSNGYLAMNGNHCQHQTGKFDDDFIEVPEDYSDDEENVRSNVLGHGPDESHGGVVGATSVQPEPSTVVIRKHHKYLPEANGAQKPGGTPVIKQPIDPKTVMFFEAIKAGQIQKVKAIFRGKNMDINTRDLNDSLAPTALITACEMDHTDVVKLLLTMKKAKHLDVNQENKMGRRPIWIAALNGNDIIADLLLNTRGAECDVNFTDKETGTAPLYRAIMSNAPRVVQLLIQAKADVNMRRLGYDLKAESPLIKATQMDNLAITTLLINALCKIQARTEDGFNALHYAVAYRRYEIAEYLLQNNINLHAKTNNGITPMTVSIEHNNPVMTMLLIEYGYKLNKRYKWKETPLSQAINLHSEECAMTLIHLGCSLTKKRGHSYFYMAIDEKLMRLAKFMAAVNPQFLQEDFIQKKEWPVSIYHRPDIFEWLKRESTKVRTLRQLCRGKIFRILGKYPTNKMLKLNLTEPLREYLSYTTHVKDEFYEKTPLNLKGECPIDCPAICSRKYCPPIEFSSSSESDSSIDDDEVEPTPQPEEEGEEPPPRVLKEKCCDCH